MSSWTSVYYRPTPKLREGNVFNSVCLFRGGECDAWSQVPSWGGWVCLVPDPFWGGLCTGGWRGEVYQGNTRGWGGYTRGQGAHPREWGVGVLEMGAPEGQVYQRVGQVYQRGVRYTTRTPGHGT